MSGLLRGIALLGVYVCGLALIIALEADDWNERAAMAFALGACGLVAALPGLRREGDDSDRFLAIALGSGTVLVASLVIAAYVVDFPAHWDPKLRIPRGQVVAAASIVSPKY